MKLKTERRINTRLKVTQPIVVQIDTNVKGSEFKPDLVGLLVDQSPQGCGLAMLTHPALQIGAQFKIQFNGSDVRRAQVRWRTDLDDEIMKLGNLYLDN